MVNKSLSNLLETLNGRLMESTYLEDRIEAIVKLREIVEKEPNSVGIHCLSPIVESMKYFVHKFHFEILMSILHSFNGREFAEILMKNEKHIKIIINARNKRGTELLLVLCHFDPLIVSEIFLRNQDLLDYFKKINHKAMDLIIFIVKNKQLRNILVERGLIENILQCLTEKQNVKQSFNLLEKILEDSFHCQNYFFNNNLIEFFQFKNLSSFFFFNVLDKFLDVKNQSFQLFQAEFYDQELLREALEMDRYDFVLKYFYNRNGLDMFLKDHNLYNGFLLTEQKKSLLEIMFKLKNVHIGELNWQNENTFYFLCNYLYMREIKNGDKNIKERNSFYAHEQHDEEIVVNDQQKEKCGIDLKNKESREKINQDLNNQMENEEFPDELFVNQKEENQNSEDFYNQVSKMKIADEFDHESLLQKVKENLLSILDLSEKGRFGVLLVANVLKNRFNFSDDLKLTKETFLENEKVPYHLQGLFILLIQEDLKIRQEYAIWCLIQAKSMITKNELIHSELQIYLEEEINTKISTLTREIEGRQSSEIKIKEKSKRESEETETINFKQSPRDVIKSFVTNMSSKFNQPEEKKKEDSFDL